LRPPLRYAELESGLMSVVRDTGRAIRTDDYEAECARHGVPAIPSSAALGHWLGVPMAAGDRVLGVLALRGGGRPFTARAERIQNPQLRQWLQVIERAALDGARTVRRLQEFTRIRRDQPFVAVDLNQIVGEALEITQARWREEPMSRGVALDVRNELAAVPKVAGDPAELREALTNLILNAV